MTPVTKSLYQQLFIQEQHDISIHFDCIYMYGIEPHPCSEEIISFNKKRLRTPIWDLFISTFDWAFKLRDRYWKVEVWKMLIHQETAKHPTKELPCRCMSCWYINEPTVNHHRRPYYDVYGQYGMIPLKKVKQCRLDGPRGEDYTGDRIRSYRSKKRRQNRINKRMYQGLDWLFTCA